MAKRPQRKIPAVEWIASTLGGLIVLGTVGFLAFEAVREGDQTPALTVSVLQVRQTAGSFVVDVAVRNTGGTAVADVQLAGSVTTTDGCAIPAQARLDYVPGFSSRRASLLFESDPGGAPTVRVVGYARP